MFMFCRYPSLTEALNNIKKWSTKTLERIASITFENTWPVDYLMTKLVPIPDGERHAIMHEVNQKIEEIALNLHVWNGAISLCFRGELCAQ